MLVPGKAPFEKVLGQEIGDMMRKDAEENGVKVVTNSRVKMINGDSDGKVKTLRTFEDVDHSADLVILGCGSKPVTRFLSSSGVELADDGGVQCNPFL